MDISMVIVLVLTAMIYLVPVVAFVVFIIWLLRRQIKFGRVWSGWMLISVVFVLLTSASFLLAKYDVTTVNTPFSYIFNVEAQGVQLPNQENLEESGKPRARIEVAFDRKTKEVFGFGSLCIEFDKGNRYVPLTFDKEGNLTGSDEALQYKDEIQDALVTDGPKIIFTGHSVSYDEMEIIKETKLKTKSNTLHMEYFMYNLFRFHLITVFLIGYYLFALSRKRNKEKRNTDFTRILDL